jgi:hypothetical protein
MVERRLLKGRPESLLGTTEVFLTELTSDEEKGRNLGEWRRMHVLYEGDGMSVLCTRKYQYKQKEWHHATKPYLMNILFENNEAPQFHF